MKRGVISAAAPAGTVAGGRLVVEVVGIVEVVDVVEGDRPATQRGGTLSS